VLHYTFTRFSDLKARRDRCDCAPTEEDAKRCFILPFDRMVRGIASAAQHLEALTDAPTPSQTATQYRIRWITCCAHTTASCVLSTCGG